jgi:uncharacterized protein DUF4255
VLTPPPFMATSVGIAAVAKSIERLLSWRFQQDEPSTTGTTNVYLISTKDLDSAIDGPALTIYLYRVEVNRVMRPAWAEVAYYDGRGHLPLDLHFIVTAWANDPEDEYRILGRAMECLEATPILSGPMLDSLNSATWAPGESIQVLLDEVSPDTVMRLFDLLPSKYQLSVPYLARVMQIDTRPVVPDLPVVAAKIGARPTSIP